MLHLLRLMLMLLWIEVEWYVGVDVGNKTRVATFRNCTSALRGGVWTINLVGR